MKIVLIFINTTVLTVAFWGGAQNKFEKPLSVLVNWGAQSRSEKPLLVFVSYLIIIYSLFFFFEPFFSSPNTRPNKTTRENVLFYYIKFPTEKKV